MIGPIRFGGGQNKIGFCSLENDRGDCVREWISDFQTEQPLLRFAFKRDEAFWFVYLHAGLYRIVQCIGVQGAEVGFLEG